MKKALVFDFGNVLMYTADRAPRWAWDDALGLARGAVERAVHNDDVWVRFQHGEVEPAAYWADVAARLALTPEQTRQLAQDFYAGDVLDMALVQAIRDWRDDGVVVGLLSNDSVELRPKLARLGLLGLFSPLVISGEIGVMKPAPGAYKAVLAQLTGYAPEQVAFVDDRLENVDGARAVGMVGVHYTQAGNSAGLVAQLGEFLG